MHLRGRRNRRLARGSGRALRRLRKLRLRGGARRILRLPCRIGMHRARRRSLMRIRTRRRLCRTLLRRRRRRMRIAARRHTGRCRTSAITTRRLIHRRRIPGQRIRQPVPTGTRDHPPRSWPPAFFISDISASGLKARRIRKNHYRSLWRKGELSPRLQSTARRNTSDAFVPPNPKELDSATLISRLRALCGTRSIGVSTDGLSRLMVGGAT